MSRAGRWRGTRNRSRILSAATAAVLFTVSPFGQDARAGTNTQPFIQVDGRFVANSAEQDFGISNDALSRATVGTDLFPPRLRLFDDTNTLIDVAGTNSANSPTLAKLDIPSSGAAVNRLNLESIRPGVIGPWRLDFLPVLPDVAVPPAGLVRLSPMGGTGSVIDTIRFGTTPTKTPDPTNATYAVPEVHITQPGNALAGTRVVMQNAAKLFVDTDAMIGEVSGFVRDPLYTGQNEINVSGTMRVGALNTDSSYPFLISGNRLVKVGAGTLTVSDTALDLQIDNGTLEFRSPGDTFPQAIGGAGKLRVSSGHLKAGAANPFNGTLLVTGTGIASGRFNNLGKMEIEPGGRFRLVGNTNQSSLNPTMVVTMAGGVFELVANSTPTNDNGPLLQFARGGSTNNVEATVPGFVSLTLAGLGSRSAGATVDFTGNVLGNNARIQFNNPPPPGLIPWATSGLDYAKFDSLRGMIPLDPAEYETNPNSPGNVAISNSSLVVQGINPATLKIDATSSPVVIQQIPGTTINLSQGGLLKVGTNSATITGGAMSSSNSPDVIVHVLQGPLTIGSGVFGPVALTKAGAGTLTLNGNAANSYAGGTFVNAGVLSLKKNLPNTAIPGNAFVNGGTLLVGIPDQIVDTADVFVNPGGTFALEGVNETVGSIVNNGGVFLSGGAFVNAASATFGPGGTNRINTSVITAPVPAAPAPGPAAPVPGPPITASTSFTALVISGGDNVVEDNAILTVKFGGLSFIGGSSPALRLANLATLKMEGDISATTIGTATIGPTVSLLGNPTSNGGTLDLAAAERTIDVTPGATLEIGATITNGSLVKSGGGVLRLTKVSTYAGGTVITGGTVDASIEGAFGTGPVTFAGGGLAFSSAGSPALNYPLTVDADMTISVDAPASTAPFPTSVTLAGLALDSSRLSLNGPGANAVTFSGTSSLSGSSSIGNVPNVMFNGAIQQGAPGAGITKDGVGTLTLGGTAANTYTGLTRINEGVLELAKTAGVNAVPANLTIGAGTVRNLASNQIADTSAVNMLQANSRWELNTHSETVASLTVTNAVVELSFTTGPKSVLRTGAMTITGTGYVDLANNGLILDYSGGSPLATIASAVQASRLRGANAVGYGEASHLFNISGTQTASWLGQTVDATAILARNTLPGDATLDAVTDFNDLVKLAQNYNVIGGKSWVDGDFTSDFNVDFNDLVVLAQNYNTSLPGGALPVPGVPPGFDADLAAAFASVPEPGAGALLVACGFASLTRRQRRPTKTKIVDGR